jgi:hypothetical protein
MRIVWDGLADDGSVLPTRGTDLSLILENLTHERLHAKLTLYADDGSTSERTQSLGTVMVDALDRERVQVDTKRLGFALGKLRFSARMHVVAELPGRDGRYNEPAISQPVFFHATNSGHPGATQQPMLAFYGKRALRETFWSGDFRGNREVEADLERAGILRITAQGKGDGDPGALREEERALAGDQMNLEERLDPGVTPPRPAATPSLPIAGAPQYRTCIQFKSQTGDSGIPIGNGPNAGGVEDYRANWNSALKVPAYGVRIKIEKDGWSEVFNTEPSTGCVTWSHPANGEYKITTYGYVTTVLNNVVRLHNDPDSFEDYPGTTYRYWSYFTPTPGGLNYLSFGNWDSEFTAMAILSFSAFRLNVGITNKIFHVATDNTSDGWCSAHWGESNSYIKDGRHYLKLDNFDADGNLLHSQRKFVVSHEFGHAFAALYYGSDADSENGGEPNVLNDHNVPPDTKNACGISYDAVKMQHGYSISSKEWNSVGFREGFAHFVAATVWNDFSSDGSFHWLGTHHDLERYGDGVGTTAGGRLENVCCIGIGCEESWENAGTIEDWMLFFWDWFTNTNAICGDRPSRLDMLRLYRDTRLGGGLVNDNYFEKMQAAAQGLSMVDCLKTDRFDFYAAFNGIDND